VVLGSGEGWDKLGAGKVVWAIAGGARRWLRATGKIAKRRAKLHRRLGVLAKNRTLSMAIAALVSGTGRWRFGDGRSSLGR
jgi:hypothetical protein